MTALPRCFDAVRARSLFVILDQTAKTLYIFPHLQEYLLPQTMGGVIPLKYAVIMFSALRVTGMPPFFARRDLCRHLRARVLLFKNVT